MLSNIIERMPSFERQYQKIANSLDYDNMRDTFETFSHQLKELISVEEGDKIRVVNETVGEEKKLVVKRDAVGYSQGVSRWIYGYNRKNTMQQLHTVVEDYSRLSRMVECGMNAIDKACKSVIRHKNKGRWKTQKRKSRSESFASDDDKPIMSDVERETLRDQMFALYSRVYEQNLMLKKSLAHLRNTYSDDKETVGVIQVMYNMLDFTVN